MKIKTTLLALGLSLMCAGALSSCAAPAIGDSNWVYYAENLACKLTLDYAGKSFWTDGVEKVTLSTAIDGDTAHFVTSTDELLKARFYGIDTPESTGDIQPYGKQASNYTKGILQEADENGTIVVSSAQYEYGTPNPDSTGQRYVSLIWVSLDKKDAAYDELMLLNLMIVEYGYSWVKNVQDMPTYSDTFYAAQSQAETYKLKLFSGEDDPLYNYGGYQDVSLLDLKNEVIAATNEGRENTYNNANLRVQGTVSGYANNILYLQDFCFYTDEAGELVDINGNDNSERKIEQKVTGEYCGINIFTGMSAIPSKFTTVGNFIQVTATGVDSENYGFQLSGASFPRIAYDENDAQVLLTAEENVDEHALYTFKYTPDQLDAVVTSTDDSVKYECLYCRVEVGDDTGVLIDDGLDSSGGGYYLYSDHSWSVYFDFVYKPYGTSSTEAWNSWEYFKDKHFNFAGVIALRTTTSGNKRLDLYIPSTSDITWVDMPTQSA